MQGYSDLRVSTLKEMIESGGNSEEVTPVPIPNTVVKLLSADDTWRATSREIRTSLLFSFVKNFYDNWDDPGCHFLCSLPGDPVQSKAMLVGSQALPDIG